MPQPKPFNKQEALEVGAIELFYDETDPLANVYPCPMKYNGVRYISAEQAYHCQKFDPELYPEVIHELMNEVNPGKCNIIVKKHKDKIRPGWEQMKFRIMIDIVYQKMIQNPDMAKLLLNTKDKYLVEDTPNDPCWGVVTNSEGIMSGVNFMGRILMIVREILLKEENI
jgi:ribA/ribD-fused uncharacterized protein